MSRVLRDLVFHCQSNGSFSFARTVVKQNTASATDALGMIGVFIDTLTHLSRINGLYWKQPYSFPRHTAKLASHNFKSGSGKVSDTVNRNVQSVSQRLKLPRGTILMVSLSLANAVVGVFISANNVGTIKRSVQIGIPRASSHADPDIANPRLNLVYELEHFAG